MWAQVRPARNARTALCGVERGINPAFNSRARIQRRPMTHLRAIAALLALAAVSPADARRGPGGHRPPALARVPVEPPRIAPAAPPEAWTVQRCVRADSVAGATVLGDRLIEVQTYGGERLRMTFARDCPFLGFYQGFYYRRGPSGQLCAGRDEVIDRSGIACPIEDIRRLRK